MFVYFVCMEYFTTHFKKTKCIINEKLLNDYHELDYNGKEIEEFLHGTLL